MRLLQVHGLRERLLQHLLLEHEATQAPEGGLLPELKMCLRRLASDYTLPLGTLPSSMTEGAHRPRLLLIESRGSGTTGPLLAVAGVLTSRPEAQVTGFQALALSIAPAPALSHADAAAEHLRAVVEQLLLPAGLIGIWAGEGIPQEKKF